MGTDSAAETQLMYRVDQLAGQERRRLWVNPAVPHPTGPAILDVMVRELRWQEMSLQSGGNGGGLYDLGNLVIEKGTAGNAGTSYHLFRRRPARDLRRHPVAGGSLGNRCLGGIIGRGVGNIVNSGALQIQP